MCLERRRQIDVSDDFAVHDDKRLVLEELARVVERAARAQYLRFFNVMKLHAEPTAVAECTSHGLRTMMQVHDDLIDAVACEILGDVTDEWFSQDWYRGFGAVFSEWPKACAIAGRKNDGAHQPYRSGSLRGGIAHHEVEGAGGDFAKARVAVERDCHADGRVLTRKLEAAFEQPIVELVYVQWSTFFAEQECHRLWNRPVHEAIAEHFDVVTNRGDLCSTLNRRL